MNFKNFPRISHLAAIAIAVTKHPQAQLRQGGKSSSGVHQISNVDHAKRAAYDVICFGWFFCLFEAPPFLVLRILFDDIFLGTCFTALQQAKNRGARAWLNVD